MASPEEHYLLSTVLVTGGSGGLASQILQLFSQHGCGQLNSIDLREPSHHLKGITAPSSGLGNKRPECPGAQPGRRYRRCPKVG